MGGLHCVNKKQTIVSLGGHYFPNTPKHFRGICNSSAFQPWDEVRNIHKNDEDEEVEGDKILCAGQEFLRSLGAGNLFEMAAVFRIDPLLESVEFVMKA